MAEKDKKPEIRFTGFSDAWEQRKLGDLMGISSASRVHKDEWEAAGVPFFRSSDVVAEFKGTDNSKAFISYELYEELAKKSGRVQKNDILVTGGGSIGIPYLVRSNAPLYFKDADLIWLKNAECVNGQFLYTFFTTASFRHYINSITHIGTISHYTIEQAQSTPICLPDKDEQKKIGQLYQELDNLITLHQRKHDKLVIVKKSMLEKMFPKDGADVPEIRFAGFTGAWEQRRLGDYFEERTQRSSEGELISVTINSGVVKASELNRHDNSSNDKSNYKKVEVGDIAYNSMRMWQGASGYSPYSGILSPAYTVVIPTEGVYSPFFAYMFKRHEMTYKFTINSQGLTSDTWNLKFPSFSIIETKAPEYDEQVKIADLFKHLDYLIIFHQREIEKLKNIKKSMLEKMFV